MFYVKNADVSDEVIITLSADQVVRKDGSYEVTLKRSDVSNISWHRKGTPTDKCLQLVREHVGEILDEGCWCIPYTAEKCGLRNMSNTLYKLFQAYCVAEHCEAIGIALYEELESATSINVAMNAAINRVVGTTDDINEVVDRALTKKPRMFEADVIPNSKEELWNSFYEELKITLPSWYLKAPKLTALRSWLYISRK